MNHVCRSKHGTFFGTLEIIIASSSGLGLGRLLVLSSVFALCLCISLPVTMYLPKGLEGRLRCPEDANPPLTYIIWKRNDEILDSDERVAIDDQGTLVISSVTASDDGNYTCTPYSPLRNVFNSFSLRIIVKDLPSFVVRPLPVYHRRIGQTVFMPCVADGDPKPVISWKKADGTFPPTTKTLQDGGNLTIVQLSEEEQGTYECIARNVVTSIITTTLLIVQVAIHSSPYNVTVEVTESTARVSWLPPYIEEGQHYEYELWCQSQDGGADIWQRFDAIPDNVTTVTVYNLQPETNYRLKIMSNHSGRPHFSREMLVRTKSKERPFPDEGDEDDEDLNSGDSSGSSTTLPDRTIVPSPADRPMPPFNVMVQELRNNSINISWLASRRSPVPVQYFVVQYKTLGQWVPLSGRIDTGQTHYEWKVPSLGATYHIRVLSYGHDAPSKPSSTVVFTRTDPPNRTHVSGGTVGGLVGGIAVVISLVALAFIAFKVYKMRAKKKRETSLASTEYASMRSC